MGINNNKLSMLSRVIGFTSLVMFILPVAYSDIAKEERNRLQREGHEKVLLREPINKLYFGKTYNMNMRADGVDAWMERIQSQPDVEQWIKDALLGQILSVQSMTQEALEHLEAAEQAMPKPERLSALLARLYYEAEQDAKAEEHFKKALEIEKDQNTWIGLARMLAELYLRQGDRTSAIEVLQSKPEVYAKDRKVSTKLIHLLMEEGGDFANVMAESGARYGGHRFAKLIRKEGKLEQFLASENALKKSGMEFLITWLWIYTPKDDPFAQKLEDAFESANFHDINDILHFKEETGDFSEKGRSLWHKAMKHKDISSRHYYSIISRITTHGNDRPEVLNLCLEVAQIEPSVYLINLNLFTFFARSRYSDITDKIIETLLGSNLSEDERSFINAYYTLKKDKGTYEEVVKVLESLSNKTHFDFLPNQGWATIAKTLSPDEARKLYEYKLQQASTLEDQADIYRQLLYVSIATGGKEYRSEILAKFLAIATAEKRSGLNGDQDVYKYWTADDLEVIRDSFRKEALQDHSAPNRGLLLGVYFRIAQQVDKEPDVDEIALAWGLTKEDVKQSQPWTRSIDVWAVSGPYISGEDKPFDLRTPPATLINWISGIGDLVPNGKYSDPRTSRGGIKPFEIFKKTMNKNKGDSYAACTIIDSPENREAVFSFYATEQHILWNGAVKVVDRPIHHQNRANLVDITLSLKEGENRILVSINSSSTSFPIFSLRSKDNCEGLTFVTPDMAVE